MIRRLAGMLLAAGAVGATAFFLLTAPDPLAAADLPQHVADVANGERLFNAGGCSSCHAAPGAKGDDQLRLGGGRELVTDFGTFRVPNISPDPASGIGGWSDLDFANAMVRGLGPSGEHLYPAFPYTSYARMPLADVLDLHAYMKTLPAVEGAAAGHDLPFPFSIRRGLGLWKRLHLDPAPVVAVAEDDPVLLRGRYLVEGPGHCGECHTPRDATGGMRLDRWLAGAPNPDGEGRIPDITPGPEGIGDWSVEDIAYSLETGFTPEFDSFGGSMVAVQEHLALLPAEDREAIAAYLKAVPAR